MKISCKRWIALLLTAIMVLQAAPETVIATLSASALTPEANAPPKMPRPPAASPQLPPEIVASMLPTV